jgi:hypothetical protein
MHQIFQSHNSEHNISIQNYCGSGLCASTGILTTRKHSVLGTGCFHPQVMEKKELTTLFLRVATY